MPRLRLKRSEPRGQRRRRRGLRPAPWRCGRSRVSVAVATTTPFGAAGQHAGAGDAAWWRGRRPRRAARARHARTCRPRRIRRSATIRRRAGRRRRGGAGRRARGRPPRSARRRRERGRRCPISFTAPSRSTRLVARMEERSAAVLISARHSCSPPIVEFRSSTAPMKSASAASPRSTRHDGRGEQQVDQRARELSDEDAEEARAAAARGARSRPYLSSRAAASAPVSPPRWRKPLSTAQAPRARALVTDGRCQTPRHLRLRRRDAATSVSWRGAAGTEPRSASSGRRRQGSRSRKREWP